MEISLGYQSGLVEARNAVKIASKLASSCPARCALAPSREFLSAAEWRELLMLRALPSGVSEAGD